MEYLIKLYVLNAIIEATCGEEGGGRRERERERGRRKGREGGNI
jgi:hypothetical protein